VIVVAIVFPVLYLFGQRAFLASILIASAAFFRARIRSAGA
jgi:hypothetical protein